MRVIFAFLALLFLFAAALQHNDPDPLRWMAIYLAAASAAILALARRRAARPAALVVGLVALGWSLTYVPSVLRHQQVSSMFDEWTMRNQEVVESRELFGLLLVAGAMAVVWFWSRRRPASPVEPSRRPPGS